MAAGVGGRPKAGSEERTTRLYTTVNEEEQEVIEWARKELGLSSAVFLRYAALRIAKGVVDK